MENFEIGDLVIIPDISYLGEMHEFVANIPYRIDGISENKELVTKLSHIPCTLLFSRFKMYKKNVSINNNYSIY